MTNLFCSILFVFTHTRFFFHFYYSCFQDANPYICNNVTTYYNRKPDSVNHSRQAASVTLPFFTAQHPSSITAGAMFIFWPSCVTIVYAKVHVKVLQHWCPRAHAYARTHAHTHQHKHARLFQLRTCLWRLIEDTSAARLRSITLPRSQRGEATVANMNYQMIRDCKMEINPGDYTTQYPTIQFLLQ